MRNKKVLFIVQAALIAAIYVALTYLSSIASYRTKCVDENRFQALKIKG
ncbi:QueT transporter family protein [Roseburia sp. OM04-10AA]|nr:QueT transporter family protein [Roseburia sp. OM04-10AA]